MGLERSRLGYTVVFAVCLLTLTMSVGFLYRDNEGGGFVWTTNTQHETKIEQQQCDVMLADMEERMLSAIKDHDDVAVKLMVFEKQREKEKEEQEQKEKEMAKEREKEKEKEKQPEKTPEQLAAEQKQKEEEKKKAEEEARIKVQEERKKAEKEAKRKALHNQLEQQYREMERNDEEHLLRNIKLKERNPEPSGQKVVIISACDKNGIEENRTRWEQMQANRQEYAKYHGYKYEFVDTTDIAIPGDKPAWGKVQAIRKVLHENPQAEWFWWIDPDALIMNESIGLAEHLLNPAVLPERITWGRPVRDPDYSFTRYMLNKTDTSADKFDVLMSHDNMGWNAGSMFFRNTQFSRLVLDIWDDRVMRDRHWRQVEQTVFTYLAFQHEEIFRRVGTVPHRLINAYLFEHSQYVHGDLVLHFAGLIKKQARYPALWDKAYNERIRVPKKYQIDPPSQKSKKQ